MAAHQKEPAAWPIELTDSHPVREGSATLYGYVTGNFNNLPGTEIYYDNLLITPNKAAAKGAGVVPKAAESAVGECLPIQPAVQCESLVLPLDRAIFLPQRRLRR